MLALMEIPMTVDPAPEPIRQVLANAYSPGRENRALLVGLDQYEVTKYRGWYHHMTMCLIALSFLKAVQGEWGKKGSLASVPEVRQLA